MAQRIVFYHSAMAGAPSAVLNTAGALIAVLDACLVNGFNSVGISTLTSSGGVATATTASNHNLSVGDWVEVAGAVETPYNGRVKVVSKPAANQFTYAIVGSPTSPATGSISVKHPGAGWLKSALAANIAAYQGGSGSLGHYLQVEDNNPFADANVSVRTRMAASLTATDTAALLGNQYKIAKNTGGWIVVADHKTCYLFMGAIGSATALQCFAFGEYQSFFGGDAYSFFQTLGASSTSVTAVDEANASLGTATWAHAWPIMRAAETNAPQMVSGLRGYSQIGGPCVLGTNGMGSHMVNDNAGSVASYRAWPQLMQVPNPVDNSIPVSPLFVNEFSTPNLALRGRYRGIFMPLGKVASGFTNSFQKLDQATIDGVAQSLLLINMNTGVVSGVGRQVAFQVDGEWA